MPNAADAMFALMTENASAVDAMSALMTEKNSAGEAMCALMTENAQCWGCFVRLNDRK